MQTKLEMREVAWAEQKPDCYDGETCDQIRARWDCFWEGDKEGGPISGDIQLDPATYPPGTRVTISMPVCPSCEQIKEICELDDCQFDWEAWTLHKYS